MLAVHYLAKNGFTLDENEDVEATEFPSDDPEATESQEDLGVTEFEELPRLRKRENQPVATIDWNDAIFEDQAEVAIDEGHHGSVKTQIKQAAKRGRHARGLVTFTVGSCRRIPNLNRTQKRRIGAKGGCVAYKVQYIQTYDKLLRRRSYLNAMLVQKCGKANEDECVHCKDGKGPFYTCIATTEFGGRCGNCVWGERSCESEHFAEDEIEFENFEGSDNDEFDLDKFDFDEFGLETGNESEEWGGFPE